jgi:endogenous inhibitor of DNA gyrase (YacG/DUF329 family)
MVRVVPPTWWMRRECPSCGQGSSLAFMSCPGCGRLIVVCQEEGTVFPEPRDLSVTAEGDFSSAICPGCERPVTDFAEATDAAIPSAGFTAADYE